MKIITGKYKGRSLLGFNLDNTRPTMDRVKESLFAMIQSKIVDSIVLDLFAGSGNLGIEAVSEGSKKAYLVDSNYQAINIIKKNINNIGIDNVEVLHMDYLKALNYLDNNEKFDIIFLDPPYKTDYIEKSIKKIEDSNLINIGGIVVCESDSLDKIIYSDIWKVIKTKKYGDKYIVLLEKL